MTGPKPQHSFPSQRLSLIRLTLAACVPLLSLTTLAAQQPAAPQHSHPSGALAKYDGLRTADQGPVLSSFEIAQGAILLHFTQTDGGLRIQGSGREAFQIAGADHIWFPADAHLVNGVVVVSTSLVQQPTAVRYTWHVTADARLFNGAGLPAAPFHTDNFNELLEQPRVSA
jgi:hypothetical protein